MYYITVSNGLLEGEHQKRMGSAVWQFMWCLDKLTTIKENGEGKVWGGKPIQLKDIKGASERTNSRNLNKLATLGYIKLIHTPYGISIIVYKAKKIFGGRSAKNGVPKRSDISGVPLTKNGVPNKTIHLDNTPKTSETSSGVKKKMKNYKENTIDYETGQPILEKPKAYKREDIIKLAQMFDKMASEYSKKQIATPGSYFIVQNAMKFPHNLKPKGIIKLYFDWFEDPKVEMENKINMTWCLGKVNINKFKFKN